MASLVWGCGFDDYESIYKKECLQEMFPNSIAEKAELLSAFTQGLTTSFNHVS